MAPSSKKKHKKKGVKGSDPMSKLTDDILADIISRVPYKSTCCCKCVSTRWRDLISHPDHRKKMPQSIAGFLYEGYNMDPVPKPARFFTNVSREGYHLIDPSLSFLPKYQSLDILDCCNGLLLCRCWKTTDPETMDYVVCNPATEKWVVVPATDWSSKVNVARLGFDPAVSSHFHVFEFIDKKVWGIDESEPDEEVLGIDESEPDEVLGIDEELWGIDEPELNDWDGRIKALAIYSSKAGAWKHQKVYCDPFAIPVTSKSAFFNGILHLAGFDDLVAAVDVEDHHSRLTEIPTHPYYNEEPVDDIFQSQGKLYFVNSSAGADGKELEVWVLEDSVDENWCLKHTVSHLQLFGKKSPLYEYDFSVISIHPEHNLLFIVGGNKKALMSYDMDSRKRRFIRQLGSDCQFESPDWREKTPYLPYVPWFSESLADGH
ncbi:unnamed protein product [Alopecurus aequalis]